MHTLRFPCTSSLVSRTLAAPPTPIQSIFYLTPSCASTTTNIKHFNHFAPPLPPSLPAAKLYAYSLLSLPILGRVSDCCDSTQTQPAHTLPDSPRSKHDKSNQTRQPARFARSLPIANSNAVHTPLFIFTPCSLAYISTTTSIHSPLPSRFAHDAGITNQIKLVRHSTTLHLSHRQQRTCM